MLSKEIVEMCRLCETQCIADFGNAPGSIAEQYLSLLQYAFGNNLCGCFTGCFFYYTIKVVYMYV
jgi:hypothetical protein